MLKAAIKTFFKSEISIGISLILVTILALFFVNSDNHQIYEDFFAVDLSLNIEFLSLHKHLTLRDWINDALMAVFFLLVGLELKREVLIGELSTKRKFALPAIAAIGGVVFPALIFIYFNIGDPKSLDGFAVPTATDIAFAYGMISLFGKRIPTGLKVFLVTLAVLDDLAAILIIAFFYTQNFNPIYLVYAGFVLIGLTFLNLKSSRSIPLYLTLGAVLWLMILKSGIHATLAGVLTAMFIPLNVKNEHTLSNLAHRIAPSVNFFILPIFAFANSGVRIEKMELSIFSDPLVVGVMCGLFLGKQFGVMTLSYLAVKMKFVNLPRASNWVEFYGASILTGIGFTMSLFIGSLAFDGTHGLYDKVKIGVLSGSLLSMIFGLLVLYIGTRKVHWFYDDHTVEIGDIISTAGHPEVKSNH